jgi:hypothetical protein
MDEEGNIITKKYENSIESDKLLKMYRTML